MSKRLCGLNQNVLFCKEFLFGILKLEGSSRNVWVDNFLRHLSLPSKGSCFYNIFEAYQSGGKKNLSLEFLAIARLSKKCFSPLSEVSVIGFVDLLLLWRDVIWFKYPKRIPKVRYTSCIIFISRILIFGPCLTAAAWF